MKKAANIPSLSPRSFWDTDIKKIDYVKNSGSVILRVFEYGTWNDIREVLRLYGEKKVVKTLREAVYLHETTLHLACFIFNLNLTRFKCFTTKQYHPL